MIDYLATIGLLLVSITASALVGYVWGHRDGYQEGKQRGFVQGMRAQR